MKLLVLAMLISTNLFASQLICHSEEGVGPMTQVFIVIDVRNKKANLYDSVAYQRMIDRVEGFNGVMPFDGHSVDFSAGFVFGEQQGTSFRVDRMRNTGVIKSKYFNENQLSPLTCL